MEAARSFETSLSDHITQKTSTRILVVQPRANHFTDTHVISVKNFIYSQPFVTKYKGVSKSFRTGSLARELQMVQLSAAR
jgi:hypothetical protein